jgi:hypothetical protein
MASVTKIVEMIEYHSNTYLLNIINSDIKFNPNLALRGKSLVSIAINNNNFDIFRALVNHSKFNQDIQIGRILQRISLCDIYENRRYLDELYKINFNFDLKYFSISQCPNIFNEIFEKIDKTDFSKLIQMCKYSISNFDTFKIIFNYLVQNFPAQMTKEVIDNAFLIPIYKGSTNNNVIAYIDLIKSSNYDILKCLNKNAPYYLCHNIYKNKDHSKIVLNYLKEQITNKYNDLFDDILSFLDITTEYNRSMALMNITNSIINSLDTYKELYISINNDKHNKSIINMFFEDRILKRWHFYESLFLKFIDMLFVKGIITTNPFEKLNIQTITFMRSILIQYQPHNLANIKTGIKNIILRCMHFGFKTTPNMKEILPLVFTPEELPNIDNLAKAITPHSFITVVKKITIKKKKEDIKV